MKFEAKVSMEPSEEAQLLETQKSIHIDQLKESALHMVSTLIAMNPDFADDLLNVLKTERNESEVDDTDMNESYIDEAGFDGTNMHESEVDDTDMNDAYVDESEFDGTDIHELEIDELEI